MSKFTTEVRFICETDAGYIESQSGMSVDEVLEKAWNKIFTTKAEVFEESYREVICKKILKHYYTREIGAETVGLWKLWVNTKFEEVVGYYNELWKSQLLDYDPLTDVNYERDYTRGITGDSSEYVDGKSDVDTNVSTTGRDLYSDTPQGALTGVDNETYLTNARKVTNVSDTGSVNTFHNTTTGNDKKNEVYKESYKGKHGGGSFSKLVMEYRDALLNVDMMFIEEFEECFMSLW